VLADRGGPLERLVTDLVLLGYRPSVHAGDDAPAGDPRPSVAVIVTDDVRSHAVPWSETIRRTDALRRVPTLWLLDADQLGEVPGNEHLVDEILTMPYPTGELGARLALLRHRVTEDQAGVLRQGPLALNPLSYQVSLDGRALDLTYMEYELVKLLIGHPGRVYTREEILAQVWGYDYYGGMRTVDVHVRRVRAKLGQDHAWLIETVRGVGYRLARVHG
jgi:DNA-binding response OmpR family regulator